MSARPRIAWFSPIDPLGDSIADFSTRQIIPHLVEYFDIELFTDHRHRSGLAVREDHFLNARRRHHDAPFDLFLYNIEDHPRARFVRAHLGLIPGVVWLHEAALADFGAEAFHASPWELTIDKYLDETAPFNHRDNPIHPLWPFAYRERSLGTMILSSSQSVIKRLAVLSGRRLESYPGGHRCVHIPLPTTLKTSAPSPIATPVFQVAAACRAGVEGQMHKVFPALKSQGTPWSLTWMIDQSELPAAERIIAEFDVQGQVDVIIGRSPATWESILAESALALHLHNSPFYRISPYLELSLLAGRPVVISSYPALREFDESLVFTIEPTMFGTAQLSEILRAVQENPTQPWAARGQAFITATHAPAKIAETLAALLSSHIPEFTQILTRWQAIERHGEIALQSEIEDLIGATADPQLRASAQIITPFFKEFGRA